MVSYPIIDKLKNSTPTLSEQETLALADLTVESDEMSDYVVISSINFDDMTMFNTMLHNFISVWACIKSATTGLEIPSYDPFAIGYAHGRKVQESEIWLAWYSNCMIIHVEGAHSSEGEPVTWLLINKETYERVRKEKEVAIRIAKLVTGEEDDG